MFSVSSKSIIYSNSEINFFKDNLLHEDDWDKDILSDIGSFSESPLSSVYSDKVNETDDSSIGFTNNYIDCWLYDELGEVAAHNDTYIKKEPLSPNPKIGVFDSKLSSSEEKNSQSLASLPRLPTTVSDDFLLLNYNICPVYENTTQGGNTQTNGFTHQKAKQEILTSSYNPILKKSKTTDKICSHDAIKPQIKIENTKYCIAQNSDGLQNLLHSVSTNYIADDSISTINRFTINKPDKVVTSPTDIPELKDYKRQLRMIKNRESACLSRQRKKEHIQSLELRVSTMTEVNQQLKEENNLLKQRIQTLENENSMLREKRLLKTGAKRSTALLSLFILYLFNPFGIIPVKQVLPGQSVQLPIPLHRSRSLLQFDNSNALNFYAPISRYEEQEKGKHSELFQFEQNSFHYAKNIDEEIKTVFRSPVVKRKEIVKQLRKKLNDVKVRVIKPSVTLLEAEADCGENFNETDLNRITESLEQLVHSSRIKKTKKKNSRHPPCFSTITSSKGKNLINNTSISCNQTSPLTQSSYFKILRERKRQQRVGEKIMNNSSQELVNAIQKSIIRKADTFYLFTLKDYMMLPATNYSSMQRPKVTFMFPAYLTYRNKNATSNKNNTTITMLQIDCHVIDTKLVDVDQNVLSKDLMPQINS